MKRSLLFLFTLASFLTSQAQYSKDICSDYGVEGCSNSGAGGYHPFSSFDFNGGFYTTPNNSMPFWIAAKSVETGLIDTTFSTSVLFEMIDGPGDLNGTLSYGPFLGYKYIDDWSFTEPGSYRIKMIMLGTILDTLNLTVVAPVDFCSTSYSEGCSDDKGDSLVFFSSSIVSVDAVFPITAGMVNKNNGFLDTTWAGVVNLSQLGGPGKMWGTKHIEGEEWVMFVDLRVDAIGVYDVELEVDGSTGIYKDTLSFEAINPALLNEQKKNKLVVYPNPVGSQLILENPFDKARVEIYSIDGKIVYSNNNLVEGDVHVDFSEFSQGVYQLRVLSFDGSINETRLVKN